MTYHLGEREIQQRAGVQLMAQRVGRGIRNQMPSIAQEFLRRQHLAVVTSVDGNGRVWTSILAGAAGFITPLDDQTVQIATLPTGDILWTNVASNPQVGMVVITLADRQRVRLNGRAEVVGEGLRIHLEQVYSNCPQYIQSRTTYTIIRPTPSITHGEQLSPSQQAWLSQSDTFFIGSYHAESGADASHRGGSPGFVRILGMDRLEFPDYSGNKMFNTLGNIIANPQTSLLFIDFVNGHTLQLSGQAEIIWDDARVATYLQAERVVEFQIEQVIETQNAIPLGFIFHNYSPVNPSLE